MSDHIELTPEVVARLTPQHRIVARRTASPEGTDSEVALWQDGNGYLRTPFDDIVRYIDGSPGGYLVVTAIIDPPAPTLATDEAERARAAGWTPPEEQPTPLPTTPGSVVERDGVTYTQEHPKTADQVYLWRRVDGKVYHPRDLQDARVLYDAGTGQAVKR